MYPRRLRGQGGNRSGARRRIRQEGGLQLLMMGVIEMVTMADISILDFSMRELEKVVTILALYVQTNR